LRRGGEGKGWGLSGYRGQVMKISQIDNVIHYKWKFGGRVRRGWT